MANTFGTSTTSKALRDKYRSSQIALALKNALVAEKVCLVDNSDLNTISSPYLTAITATVQAKAGTYTTGDNLTTTDEQLTVSDEVIAVTHIYDFETVTSNFDLFFTAHQEMTRSMSMAIDKWVINNLCEDGNGAYTTPAGGFTTSANVITIISNIIAKCAGYADAMGGLYVIVENTDLAGIIPAIASSGFRYADDALMNGIYGQILGVDIYVVRSGTFVDATTTSASGSKTWTNSGHRVGGVKRVSTYASPRGLRYEEKGVTQKTGMEVVGIGYIGFKQWTPTRDLTIDITIA
jgi:hypothetical protein